MAASRRSCGTAPFSQHVANSLVSQLPQRLPDKMALSFLEEEINPVSRAKGLGVTLDRNLTYDDHISELTTPCLSKLCQTNRVKDSFDNYTLKVIISALVMSKLYYCSSVWSNTSACNIKKLQTLQDFACRIVTNTKIYAHIIPALRKTDWLPVKQHLLYRDTVMSFKCMNELTPTYLCELFRKRDTNLFATPEIGIHCIFLYVKRNPDREFFVIEQ